MKLLLAQLNPVIGDLDGNAEKIFEVCKNIKVNDVVLVITPELSLIGYPPKDLLFNPLLFGIKFSSLSLKTLASLSSKYLFILSTEFSFL